MSPTTPTSVQSRPGRHYEHEWVPDEVDELNPTSVTQEKSGRADGESEQPAVTAANNKRKRTPRATPPASRLPRIKSRPGREYENQWRVGQAPTAGLKASKEQKNFDQVLGAVSRYYEGNAEGTWKHALRHNAAEYQGKGLTESIGASVLMAAGLVAAGEASNATAMLDRTLPLAEIMLTSQHPQVCFWLLDACMDTGQTVYGNIRRAIKAQFEPLATRLLGPDHPSSLILRIPLTADQQARMRYEGQRVAHDCHVRTFGTYSYQTLVQQWLWGRITAADGQFDEAIRLLQDLTQTWEQLYATPNSAVVASVLVELARVMVASGDASVRVECMLGDALRRMDVIASTQSDDKPILDAAELRMREGGLIFSRLAALRTLGRIHIMRRNLDNAKLCYEQAVTLAATQLGPHVSARRLCEIELEATKVLEFERAMGMLSIDDPTSRFPPVNSIMSLLPANT